MKKSRHKTNKNKLIPNQHPFSAFKIFRMIIELRILWQLKNKPTHGYKLVEQMCPHSDLKNSQHSRIYPVLYSLEKQGLIISRLKYIGKRKRKEYYTSSKGKKHLEKFKRSLTDETVQFLKYLCK
jgi:DNA-binding PadR family transcriptional regulator